MNFLKNGITKCGKIFNETDCRKLLREIYNLRDFNTLFLSQKIWKSKKFDNLKKNPGPGRNLLHKLETQFIFENKNFIKIMSKVLGDNYRILDFKLVMAVPKHLMPKWVLAITENDHTVNLGEFILPQYRDITYFRGIDFHQDIIDYPTRNPDFITAYIYLENVDKNSSPLHIVPNSHLLGASVYPHKIEKFNKNLINYKSNKKNLISKFSILTGRQGSLNYWHPYLLHGTQPHKKDVARISVRLLIEKNRQVVIGCDLDKLNDNIKNKKTLKIYNKEFSKNGINKKRNFINKLDEKG